MERLPRFDEENVLGTPFKETLINATLSENVSMDGKEKVLNLGNISEEAEKLIIQSLRDYQGFERAISFYVTNNRSLIASKEVYVGKKTWDGASVAVPHHFEVNPDYMLLPRFRRQDKFIATIMHTHGAAELPPSMEDISCLFRERWDPGIAPCVFVVTPTSNLVMFRGEKTPNWNERMLWKKMNEWQNTLTYRMINFLNLAKSEKGKLFIGAKTQALFLKDIARAYNLHLYQGEVGESEIKKVEEFKFDDISGEFDRMVR